MNAHPAAARPSTSARVVGYLRLAVLGAVAVAIAVGFLNRGPEQKVEVGACLDGTGDVEVVACDDSRARYRVVESLGISTPAAGALGDAPSCEQGEPYALSTAETQRGFEPVWCLVAV